MTPKKPTSRDRATAARRRQILEAAVMCFLENGYHQTGVRDIAARAGVSLGNLYNHFPGKHDVLVEIARLERQELAAFLALLAKDRAAPKLLDQFITRYAKYQSAPEQVLLSIELTSEAIRKEDIGALFMDNRAELISALTGLLARGIDSGAFRTDLGPQEAAHMILELIEASAYRCVLSNASMRRLLPGIKTFVYAGLGCPR